MIVGAISGLIGWQASNLIGLSITHNVYLAEIPVGAIIGLIFGPCLGAIGRLADPQLGEDPQGLVAWCHHGPGGRRRRPAVQ